MHNFPSHLSCHYLRIHYQPNRHVVFFWNLWVALKILWMMWSIDDQRVPVLLELHMLASVSSWLNTRSPLTSKIHILHSYVQFEFHPLCGRLSTAPCLAKPSLISTLLSGPTRVHIFGTRTWTRTRTSQTRTWTWTRTLRTRTWTRTLCMKLRWRRFMNSWLTTDRRQQRSRSCLTSTVPHSLILLLRHQQRWEHSGST